MVPNLVVPGIVFGALVVAGNDANNGITPSFRRGYASVLPKIGILTEYAVRYFGAVGLLTIGIVGIPFAIRTLVRWVMGTQAIVLDDLNAKEAISYSCRLVKGIWWRIVGTILAVFLMLAPMEATFVILWWPYSVESILIGAVVNLVIGPALALFWTTLFLCLESRRGHCRRRLRWDDPQPSAGVKYGRK